MEDRWVQFPGRPNDNPVGRHTGNKTLSYAANGAARAFGAIPSACFGQERVVRVAGDATAFDTAGEAPHDKQGVTGSNV